MDSLAFFIQQNPQESEYFISSICKALSEVSLLRSLSSFEGTEIDTFDFLMILYKLNQNVLSDILNIMVDW